MDLKLHLYDDITPVRLTNFKYFSLFMLRGLDACRVPLLATDPLSSDWPCTLLSIAVYYY